MCSSTGEVLKVVQIADEAYAEGYAEGFKRATEGLECATEKEGWSWLQFLLLTVWAACVGAGTPFLIGWVL